MWRGFVVNDPIKRITITGAKSVLTIPREGKRKCWYSRTSLPIFHHVQNVLSLIMRALDNDKRSSKKNEIFSYLRTRISYARFQLEMLTIRILIFCVSDSILCSKPGDPLWAWTALRLLRHNQSRFFYASLSDRGCNCFYFYIPFIFTPSHLVILRISRTYTPGKPQVR